MSLLKDAIKKGISESVSKAVKEAATNVVAPAVNKMAEAASAKINETTAEIAKDLNEAGENINEATVQAEKAAKENGTDLGSLFNNLMSNATEFAGNIASNLKECPKCKEAVPADNEFCPYCGTKLPENTIAQGFTCSVCGTVNPLGQAYCSKCGGKLNATIDAEKKLSENWPEDLKMYPVWNCGGTEFYFEENGDSDGHPVYALTVENSSEDDVNKYVALLKENGFVVPEGYESSYVLTKKVNGVSRAFVYEDCYSDRTTTVNFLVRDYAPIKKTEQQKTTLSGIISDNQETIDKAAEVAKDVAGEAIKAFSGLFGKKK